jgi:transposase InsO family protein
MGHSHSRNQVAGLMRLAGLAGRYPRRSRRTTITDPLAVIPDLVQRNLAPTGPNQLWVGDITFIRTWVGWLHLAVLVDCYSRRVVGWSMADHLRAELPLNALQMSLASRGPAPQLVHPDRSCQYTSEGDTNVLGPTASAPASARPATAGTTPSPRASSLPSSPI